MGDEKKEEATSDDAKPKKLIRPVFSKPLIDVGQDDRKNIIEKLPEYYGLEPSEFVTASGTMIGGTISALEGLRTTLQDAGYKTSLLIESSIDKKLTQDLKPIQEDLESTKKQVEDASETLKTLGSFIESNKHSFVSLISVEGKMGGMESQMSSFQTRIEKLETDKNITWNKNTTIIALIIGFIGSCCGVLGVIVAFFSYFR